MKVSFYTNYFKKCWKMLWQLHKEEKISMPWLLVDYTWCLVWHGCLIRQYVDGGFYKLQNYMRNRCFTQRRLESIIRKHNNGNYTHILENKNEFNKFYHKYIERSWLYCKHMTKDEFCILCNNSNSIFLKPLNDQEGHGIKRVSTINLEIEKIYNEFFGKDYIVEAAIIQHPCMCFNSQSVNTVRILTVLDNYRNAKVLRAGLGVGVGNSIVDNFTAGGVLYEIDAESGIISHKGIRGNDFNLVYHPNTDRCMLGFQIPHWQKVVQTVCDAAVMLPQCRFIGWDVAITENGVELIEGNHNPGVFTLESLGTPGAFADAKEILK